jgi:hypothetical protein
MNGAIWRIRHPSESVEHFLQLAQLMSSSHADIGNVDISSLSDAQKNKAI